MEDVGPNAYHLTEINYGSGNLAYTEVSGNRGLESISTTGTQRARRAIDNTSDALRDAMAGVQKATIEVVVRADAFNASGSRIFGINGRAGQNGEFIFKGISAADWKVAWNDTDLNGFSGTLGTRYVWHIVIDTTKGGSGTGDHRLTVYRDGSLHFEISTGIALNDTLTLAANLDLIACNRESGGSFDRSFDGVLFYDALYAHAFSAADVTNNYDILTLDDDPGGGGGGSTDPVPRRRRSPRGLLPMPGPFNAGQFLRRRGSTHVVALPQSIAVGQVTEADAAQALTAAKAKALGQIVESDVAQAITAHKIVTLGQATETDAAQPIGTGGHKIIQIGQALETNAALGASVVKRLAIAQVIETDSAIVIARAKVATLGQAIETDTAQPIGTGATGRLIGTVRIVPALAAAPGLSPALAGAPTLN